MAGHKRKRSQNSDKFTVEAKVKKIKLDLDGLYKKLNHLDSDLRKKECQLKVAEQNWDTGDDILTARGLLSITNEQIKLYQSRIEQTELKLHETEEALPRDFYIQSPVQFTWQEVLDTLRALSPQIVNDRQIVSNSSLIWQIDQTLQDRVLQIITQLDSFVENCNNIYEMESLLNKLRKEESKEKEDAQSLQHFLDKAKQSFTSAQKECVGLQKLITQTEQKYCKLEKQLNKLIEANPCIKPEEQPEQACYFSLDDDYLTEILDPSIIGDINFFDVAQ
ncbi:hypothetical protein [Candidatus Phycorickettsia trachydisci]|nr:hypothetical protein [Candidatus Phycorickettsia trachydisci]